MGIAEPQNQHDLEVLPEREQVCLRPGAALDARALNDLEAEARRLIGRGFEHVTIDLRAVETVDWTAGATLAAVSRFARRSGARLTVIPGRSPAVQEIWGVGLMEDVVIDTPARRLFFDWSR